MNPATTEKEVTTAASLAPDGRMQGRGAVPVLGCGPTRSTFGHQAHLQKSATAAWTAQGSDPEMATFADQINRIRLPFIREFWHAIRWHAWFPRNN